MADIIVDLPSRRDSNSSIEGSNKKYMSVQFSQTIDIQLFECHDDINASEIWYSELDYELMKIARKQAVYDLRRIIRSPIKTEDLGNGILTGLERHLTPKITKKTIVSKVKGFNAVLVEQDRQNLSGEYDQYKLRRVSRRHTKWVAKRAYT
eukprot:CAMPEP_0201875042 /NCGR_PEP_ID=MMETSP0902-20130614/7129_1 /ASSEMBLY_ACC=CAM_ASM_000551 /TAXON_ID=420261 /ORGANISM="Thalassiosira antarctica, Strain CCMP982" /LENGTH=150 /DNA_ID=CAMNT_0048402015 /DNA_START=235 /DNA_END=684 /DNA_ORIENTATION=+